jgi:murein DD-endopeptidase MepM/ murein hydrolase activator NlpD
LVQLKRVFGAVLCVLGLAAGAAMPAAAATGGAMASDPKPLPAITEIACAARCSSLDAVAPGSLLRVRGTAMGGVRKVAFLGARGAADDVIAPALRARVKSVDVLVPERAPSGPVLAINSDGGQSAVSRAAVSVRRAQAGGSALDVRVVGKQVFVGAARPARVDLLARQSMAVAVALVRLSDGAIVQGWPLGILAPGIVKTVTWDGTLAGVSAPIGRYEFRVFNQGTGVQAAQTPAPLATGSFDLVDHKFPIRGKHTYGTGVAAFGAGRNGHTHQGQDVFAACGTPLVAARGGVVKLNQNEANAGNYIVIDGAGTDVDYVYMHMAAPSPLKKGATVMTGQAIGNVGDTGDARGCHLHFEMWGKPGWYTGGAPIDPVAALKAWDLYS